jgi:hypothetical protein
MSDIRTTAEILRAAKERIADQGHFVMGAWAWNRKGVEVDPINPAAWRWSARGAIWAESGVRPLPFKERDRDQQAIRLLDQASEALAARHDIRLPVGKDYSDNLGHALTLQALEDAAVLAEAEAPAATSAAHGHGGA